MSNEHPQSDPQEEDSGEGILITEGMWVTIPECTLQLGPDGEIQSGNVMLQLEVDVCYHWLEIALGHLRSAEEASDAVQSVGDGGEKGPALEKEFTSGMQAITASAFAIDGYYAAVKKRADLDKDSLPNPDTARYKQIAEVIKRAFPGRFEPFEGFRSNLGKLMDYRDEAVHPSAGASNPMVYPELDQPTARRFVIFRFANAQTLTGLAISIISTTAEQHKWIKAENLKKYCRSLSKKIENLKSEWVDRYGEAPGPYL